MGSALGARLREGGARVLVALDGRSARTSRFADEAGLEDVGSRAVLVREAAVVLSVVPPESALAVARDVAAAAGEARPLVVDLNATSPETVQRLAEVLDEAGDRARRRRDLRAAAASRRDDADLSLRRARGRGRPAPARRRRAGRRGRRRRIGVGREDVHRFRLQGSRRSADPGAPHRACPRRGGARPRRPRGRRPRRPRAHRRDARPGVGEGVALRRGDGGDRRDAAGCGPVTRPLPRAVGRLRRSGRPRRGGRAGGRA